MRLLVLDLETSGLGIGTDRAIEVGLVLYDTEIKLPLFVNSELLYDDTYPPLGEEITKLTGITSAHLNEFGKPAVEFFEWFNLFCEHHRPDFFVAHNGNAFDRPFLEAEFKRNGLTPKWADIPWIDTTLDLPPRDGVDSKRLKYLAADHGVINLFPHRAVFDVLTTLKVLCQYELSEVIMLSRIPTITIKAEVPAPWTDSGQGKDAAKANGFRWEQAGNKFYPKCWVKSVKADQIGLEQIKMRDYKVVVIT